MKLGYRQRLVLQLLTQAGKPLPLGYISRICDAGCPSAYNNTSASLRNLRDKGLVRQVRYGWWELAA